MLDSESVNNINVVEIKVNGGAFNFEMEEVKEIKVPNMQIISIPLADEKILGVIDVRGEIYTVLSLRNLLHDVKEKYEIDKDSRILLLEDNKLNIGIMVDSVHSIRRLPASIFESQSSIIETDIDWKFVKSIGVIDNETILVLDVNAILSKLEEEKQAVKQISVSIPAPERYIPKSPPKLEVEQEEVTQDIEITAPAEVIVHQAKDHIEFTQEQQDALKEIGNIGSGNAITALSRLINKRIDVDLTDIGIISFKDLHKQFGGKNEVVCGIFSHIKEPSQSTILQVFEMTPLMEIVANLAGDESNIVPKKVKSKNDLDEFAISTISEVGNILAGHYASSIADLMGKKLEIGLPEFAMANAGELGDFLAQEVSVLAEYIVLIKTALKVMDFEMKGFFFFIPDVDSLESFFTSLGIQDVLFKTVISMPDQPIVLTPQQRDALQEIGNIGAGNAANALAKIINMRVDINIPAVEMVELDAFATSISKKNLKLFVAWSNVVGHTRATVLSIFKVSDIIKLSSIMIEESTEAKTDITVASIKSVNDFPDLHRSAVAELGHILASHYMTALGDLLGIRLMTEPPDMSVDTGSKLFDILKEEIGLIKKLSLVINTAVIIRDIKITGTFLFIPEIDTLENLLEALSQFI